MKIKLTTISAILLITSLFPSAVVAQQTMNKVVIDKVKTVVLFKK